MRIVTRIASAIVIAGLGAACNSPTPKASVVAAPAPNTMLTPPANPFQAENDSTVQAEMATIIGKENQPASQVFVNVKFLTNTRARTFLEIMNGGYAKALGVRCSYCHVTDDFASDEKRPKRAAREMQLMHRAMNQELQKMEHLETPPPNRPVSCIVCHRGTTKPHM